MDDVATLKSENANLRKIQARLLQWEQKDNPLAPLSSTQNEFINQLAETLGGTTTVSNLLFDTCYVSINEPLSIICRKQTLRPMRWDLNLKHR